MYSSRMVSSSKPVGQISTTTTSITSIRHVRSEISRTQFHVSPLRPTTNSFGTSPQAVLNSSRRMERKVAKRSSTSERFMTLAGKKQLRVLLVFPTCLGCCPPRHPPIGLVSLGTLARMQGHEVRIRNLDLLKERAENIPSEIASFQPHVVGISCLAANYNQSLKVAEMAKSVDPDIVTVIGGSHFTLSREHLELLAPFDIGVVGEGEVTFSELLAALQTGREVRSIPGIVYRDRSGRTVPGDERPLISDLDTLPFPDYSLVPNLGAYDSIGVATSRGCPSRCTFCAAGVLWRSKYRQRSAPNVVEELVDLSALLRSLRRHPTVSIVDDTFLVNQRRAEEICCALLERGLDIKWECEGRAVDLQDIDLLRLMKRAGCGGVFIGIESGSPHTLRRVGKGCTRETIANAISLVNRAGMKVTGGIIIGFPWETEENILETARFVKDLPLHGVSVTFATPLPGTKLRESVIAQGRELDSIPWDEYNFTKPMISPLPASILYHLRELIYDGIKRQ